MGGKHERPQEFPDPTPLITKVEAGWGGRGDEAETADLLVALEKVDAALGTAGIWPGIRDKYFVPKVGRDRAGAKTRFTDKTIKKLSTQSILSEAGAQLDLAGVIRETVTTKAAEPDFVSPHRLGTESLVGALDLGWTGAVTTKIGPVSIWDFRNGRVAPADQLEMLVGVDAIEQELKKGEGGDVGVLDRFAVHNNDGARRAFPVITRAYMIGVVENVHAISEARVDAIQVNNMNFRPLRIAMENFQRGKKRLPELLFEPDTEGFDAFSARVTQHLKDPDRAPFVRKLLRIEKPADAKRAYAQAKTHASEGVGKGFYDALVTLLEEEQARQRAEVIEPGDGVVFDGRTPDWDALESVVATAVALPRNKWRIAGVDEVLGSSSDAGFKVPPRGAELSANNKHGTCTLRLEWPPLEAGEPVKVELTVDPGRRVIDWDHVEDPNDPQLSPSAAAFRNATLAVLRGVTAHVSTLSGNGGNGKRK